MRDKLHTGTVVMMYVEVLVDMSQIKMREHQW